jgi:hypothetical protein
MPPLTAEIGVIDLDPPGEAARERNPRRWSGATCNWTPITVVTLNPERDSFAPIVDVAAPASWFDRRLCFSVPT